MHTQVPSQGCNLFVHEPHNRTVVEQELPVLLALGAVFWPSLDLGFEYVGFTRIFAEAPREDVPGVAAAGDQCACVVILVD